MQRLRGDDKRLLFTAWVLLLLGGCFNNNLAPRAGSSRSTVSGGGTTGTTPAPGSTPSISGFSIAQALRNAANPGGLLDLIGDNSGVLGAQCAIDMSGHSRCSCEFSFSLPDGTSQLLPLAVTYLESNLVRCTFGGIAPSATNLTVRLKRTDTGATTNTFLLPVTGMGGAWDLNDPGNFAEVLRYQCRDIPGIPYPLDSSVYDPVLSEDPSLNYGLNFYSTNYAKSMAYFASYSRNEEWFCPARMNDPSARFGLEIYSARPVTGIATVDLPHASTIFPLPPHGSSVPDRQTFLVAKTASGIFSQPLYAQTFPSALKVPSVSNTPPQHLIVGYGVKPIVDISGQELCPDQNTPIPAGFKWVKVWLFRADLQPRKRPFSQALTAVGSIACDPGLLPANAQLQQPAGYSSALGCHSRTPATALADPTFCALANQNNLFGSPAGAAQACPALGADPGRTLVDRVLCTVQSNGNCFDQCVSTLAAGGAATRFPANFSNLPRGADLWAPKALGSYIDYDNCPGIPGADPLGLCGAPGFVSSSSPNRMATPIDTALTYRAIDSAGRYDYLFVVTPTNLQTAQMQSIGSTLAQAYLPIRLTQSKPCLLNPADTSQCLPDPTDPTACMIHPTNPSLGPMQAACAPYRLQYGLKLHDILTNGDPSAADPGRGGSFPVCALQRL